MPRVRSFGPGQHIRLLLLITFAAIGVVAYAKTAERTSVWREHEIVVDGSDEEWRSLVLPVKGQHFSLGLVNDGEYLYLCVPTSDAGTKAMIANMGLVVWIDREGRKRKFGLHFPVPDPPHASGLPRIPNRSPKGNPEGSGPESGPPDVPGQQSIGVLAAGGADAKLVPIDDAEAAGIEARVGVHGDVMVYEMKIPLKQNDEHRYAPNVDAGTTVRVEIEVAPLRGGTPPTVPGGVAGTPAQPWGGGWGVTFPGPKGIIIDPFDVTMNVHLAKGPQ